METTQAASQIPPIIPSMLRDELFHPAVVHFPIAFLALSGLLALFWFISRRGYSTLFLIALLGVAGGWIAILTGGWAEDVVNRVICDPTITHEHEKWAEWAVWAASAGLVGLSIHGLLARFRKTAQGTWLFRACVALGFMFSSGAVLWAGHLGASLVYQQGAGVYHPTPQCTEFE